VKPVTVKLDTELLQKVDQRIENDLSVLNRSELIRQAIAEKVQEPKYEHKQ